MKEQLASEDEALSLVLAAIETLDRKNVLMQQQLSRYKQKREDQYSQQHKLTERVVDKHDQDPLDCYQYSASQSPESPESQQQAQEMLENTFMSIDTLKTTIVSTTIVPRAKLGGTPWYRHNRRRGSGGKHYQDSPSNFHQSHM